MYESDPRGTRTLNQLIKSRPRQGPTRTYGHLLSNTSIAVYRV
jgi:hypothetical protein